MLLLLLLLIPFTLLLLPTPVSDTAQLAAVEKDPQLKLVDQDAEGLYILAKAKSAVPPDGFDKVEFLFK